LTPVAHSKLTLLKQQSIALNVQILSPSLARVVDDKSSFIVTIDTDNLNVNCECGRPETSSFPCVHIMGLALQLGQLPER